MHSEDDASRLRPPSLSILIVQDALRVMRKEVFEEWRSAGMPLLVTKDLIQLHCLVLSGGWWADLDAFCVRREPPPVPNPFVASMLGSDFERSKGVYQKSSRRVVHVDGAT